VLRGIALNDIGFAEPLFLWLLVLPGVLAALWLWRVARRSADVRRYKHERLPRGGTRFNRVGDLAFWLCLIAGTSLCMIALARPQLRMAVVHRASADIVILQDASASMYTRDVLPDRWQRSIAFLRVFANSLSWRGDRVALALFAQLAAPQLRLTKDPNALFFFLDHLGTRSPFDLADAPTWDTNIGEGIEWGLKLVETDERLFGKTGNPKAFVVISDGQAWSGNVASALAHARDHNVIVHVVGVGTAGGGVIPDTAVRTNFVGPAEPSAPIRAVLDRDSLRHIAQAGGGEYFEIGREGDREMSARVINSVRKRAGSSQVEERREDVYWQLLVAAAVIVSVGTFLLRSRAELWWQAAGVIATLLILATAFK
jgi:Ca-activated chloride channel homolog